MRTPAQIAGFVVGKTYTLVRRDDQYSNWAKGTQATFIYDDTTDAPRFGNGCDERYVSLNCFDAPATVSGEMFEDKEVTTVITVINAGRQLSQREKDAIQAIIEQGA